MFGASETLGTIASVRRFFGKDETGRAIKVEARVNLDRSVGHLTQPVAPPDFVASIESTRFSALSELVGQWRGSSHSEKNVFNIPVEVTIAPDGTFQAGEYDPVTNRFSGRLRIENGRVRYSQRRDTGFLAFYEVRDRDILTGRISGPRDDGSTAAYVVYLERETSREPPPLPADLKVVSPVPTVPAERAAYSGKWSGRMDNGVDQILVVEEVAMPA